MHALQPGRLVQRLQRRRERDRAAVRVGDDAVALERLERALAVHLGHDQRVAVDEAVGRGLVDADRAAGRGVRNELLGTGGSDREQAEVEIAGAERLGRRLLDDESPVAEGELAPGRALGGKGAHVPVAALGEKRQGQGADGAGGADDADAGVLEWIYS